MAKSQNNNGLLLLTGAIAGAAITYYLNTPRGKEMTHRAIQGSKDYVDNVSTTAHSLAQTAQSRVNDAMGSASTKYAEVKNDVVTKANDVLKAAADKVTTTREAITDTRQALSNGKTLDA